MMWIIVQSAAFSLEVVISFLLFIRKRELKKFWLLFSIAAMVGGTAVGGLSLWLLWPNDILLNLSFIVVLAVVFVCCIWGVSLRPVELLYRLLGGYVIQHIADRMVAVVQFCNVSFFKNSFFIFVRLAVDAAIYALLYYTLIFRIKRGIRCESASIIMLGLFALFYANIYSFLFGTTANALEIFGTRFLIYIAIDVAGCILILCSMLSTSKKCTAEEAYKNLKQMRIKAENMYSLLQTNIDIINMKCHDLKHFINNYGNGVLSEPAKQEIMRAVTIYDSKVNTGNEYLDMILMDKKLKCEVKGICFCYTADGANLASIDPIDLFTIFDNMLENAIEYESGVADSGKRFINFSIKKEKEAVVIRCENYLEGKLKYKNGLPITTKGDEINHGFGMRSIQSTIKKYDGFMAVHDRDNMFTVCVSLFKTG